MSNFIAYWVTQFLKTMANLFFQDRYGHRAVVLETIAAVPGMVAAFFCHLESLRKGTVHTTPEVAQMLHEAENERMHLMIVLKVTKPTFIERFIIIVAQLLFTVFYSLLYLISRRTCHKIISNFEQEAVKSYSNYISLVELGKLENVQAPQIAIDYYSLAEDAKLLDVLHKIRDDETAHYLANEGIVHKLDA